VTETACGEVKKKKKKTEPTLAQTEWQFQEPTFREDALNFKTK
jgi:hypothetical protein